MTRMEAERYVSRYNSNAEKGVSYVAVDKGCYWIIEKVVNRMVYCFPI